jgi:hypothetical protein
VSRLRSSLETEHYEHEWLRLTIQFDLAQGGWVVGLSSPRSSAANSEDPWKDRIYSQVLIPAADFAGGKTEEYLADLLAMHLERLGLRAAW